MTPVDVKHICISFFTGIEYDPQKETLYIV